MKLLIVTQKVDFHDQVLGFFHRWIEEFSKSFDEVTVICLEKGEHALPENVRILSLGKEEKRSRLRYILHFYRYVWKERERYDAVFVHMNPEYAVLGGPVFALLNKPLYLWYVHRQVNLKLRVALVWARRVFTSSPESLRVRTKKVLYVGHGIDTERFSMAGPRFSGLVTMLHLGRITRIKRIEVFIDALKLLREERKDVALTLAGAPVTEDDEAYKRELVERVSKIGLGDRVEWAGVTDPREALLKATLSLNGAPTGGMDKAVIESLAAKRPVFVANQAFQPVMGEYWDFFSYRHGGSAELTAKIKLFLALPQGQKEILIDKLEEKVRVEYDVRTLIKRIISTING